MRPLYVMLEEADRALLDKLAADAGVSRGRSVTVADVVRQLVRDAAMREKPLRIDLMRQARR